MKMLRDELDLRRKTEIHEVEERKNGQISVLMQRHEEAFTDIKNYYNDITLNNLALINSLKVLMPLTTLSWAPVRAPSQRKCRISSSAGSSSLCGQQELCLGGSLSGLPR